MTNYGNLRGERNMPATGAVTAKEPRQDEKVEAREQIGFAAFLWKFWPLFLFVAIPVVFVYKTPKIGWTIPLIGCQILLFLIYFRLCVREQTH